MANDKQPWNTLGSIEKAWIASKSSLNAAALSSEGNSVPLKECAIETLQISTLGEYLADKKVREGTSFDADEIQNLKDDKNLEKTYVIPVVLPNGQQVEVVVNKKGQDMACMYTDENGEQHMFELTPRMKKEIESSLEHTIPKNLEEIVGKDVIDEIKAEYLPQDIEGLAENISKDELKPKGKQDVLDKINVKTGVQEERNSAEREENAEKELPPETRDIVARICSENNLDISSLKEVMEVPPQAISENLENTGFRENDGRVTCLRFRDGEKLQGRVVMVQGSKVVDNRMYDDYMNDYMNEHRGEKRVKTVDDEHDKLTYTDLDGNTTVCEIIKEPRDLGCSEKEDIQEKMYELEMKAKQIIGSPDMPPEEKAKAFASVNQERLDLLKGYGVECPLVESEIQADIEIAEEMQEAVPTEDEPKQEDEIEEDNFDELGRHVRPGLHH